MADQQFSIHKQEILQKQLKQTMSSLGEMDKRINELEALVLASFKKMQVIKLLSLTWSLKLKKQERQQISLI